MVRRDGDHWTGGVVTRVVVLTTQGFTSRGEGFVGCFWVFGDLAVVWGGCRMAMATAMEAFVVGQEVWRC